MRGRAGRTGVSFVALVFLVFMCSLAIQCVDSNNVFATSSTLTLSITDNITLNMLPSTNGTFATSDTTTPNISVTTDHATGYTLGIKASSEGANALVNTTDPNETIPSISSSSFPSGVSESDYSDDTYASTNNLNNTWGYRPSKINSTANSNYLPAPTSSSNTAILDQTSTANPTANNYNIAIGTRVDNTTAVGSYAATFIITAVVNPITYSITYNDNSSSAGTGFPSNVVNQQTMDTAVQLSSTTPTRTTYDFAGWCTVNTADNGTCSGTQYSASGNWTLDQTTNPNSLTLYAMWNIKTHSLAITFAGTGVNSVKICTVSGDCTGDNLKGTVSTSGNSISGLVEGSTYYLYPAFSSGYELDNWANTGSYGTLSSTSVNNPTFTIGAGDGAVRVTGKQSCQSTISGTMQAFDPSKLCSGVTSGTLSDSRDNQSYKVAKLADGKWWMLDNLALDLTNSSVKAAMYNTTDTKTNATYAQLGYLFNGGGSNQYAATGVANWTSLYSYTQPLVNLTNKNVVPSDATSQAGQYKVGGYYNYCAASAGTYCWPASSAPSDSQDGVRNIDADICPKGWSIPTGNTNGEYQALYNNASYNTYANYRAALHLPLSGYFNNGSAGDQGSKGSFWSSTRHLTGRMYILFLNMNNSYVGTSSLDVRDYGNSVRCRMGD